MPDPVQGQRSRPIAWGPIILLCGTVIYMIGVIACMVAGEARGWLS
jgi:hypothetical protein